ncbi:MAG: type II toxin-antitoxin system Phd/YefM family antitoxin [Sedimentisphaerales bacterium]|nr:type II toxin-antitoxin system Phd/YefM family antitoxin [Sedimentisphaerales bacterium]
MVHISFTEFRDNAKDYFDAVEKGETVQVTRHGKVIAEISSPRRVPSWKKWRPKLTLKGISVSDMVIEERRQGR